MITRPTCSQLLKSVRDELRHAVAPLISDPEVLARLTMIDSILSSVALRTEHEVAWIREEISQIEGGARRLIEGGADVDGRVAHALDELEKGRSPDLHIAGLHAEYNLAGEVLSCSIESAMRAGGALRQSIEQILAARLAREVEIRGEFSLAGRR